MTDRTTELLPCPFCGGEAHVEKYCDMCSTEIDFKCSRDKSPDAICAIGEEVFWVEHECRLLSNDEELYVGCFTSARDAIAAWNTRAELGSERIAELEAENERLRKAGYEIGYHDAMKAAKRGGTLTAEQVEIIVNRNCEWYEGGELDAQAIADELNAELGSGTCEFNVVEEFIPGKRQRSNICECSNCGYRCAYGFIVDERFKCCPSCGKRIRKAVER